MKGETNAGAVTVTGSMIDSMRATKPWTGFLAFLGFIAVALMALAGSVVTFFSSMFPKETGVHPVAAGLFFTLLSLLCFFPAFYLYRYSSAVGDFLRNGTGKDMETVLSYHRSFWRIIGISVLTLLISALLAIAAFLLLPMAAATGML